MPTRLLRSHPHNRRGLVTGGACLAALLVAEAASAAPPACFPERTVTRGATLEDMRGHVMGVVAAGTVVKVVNEHLDDPDRRVDVVIEKPFRLEARVPANRLEVYARRDIEVVPGLAWWAGGAPMRIFAARPGEALVGPLHQAVSITHPPDAPLAGPSWTPCEALAGSSSHVRGRDCCNEAWSYTGRDRGGEKVRLRRKSDEVRFENEAGNLAVTFRARNLKRIRQEGRRSLVWTLTGAVVIEGWVAEPLVARRYEGTDVISGCLDESAARRWWWAAKASAGLLVDTPFFAELGGAPSGTLPAGARVDVLERAGLHARVRFRRLAEGVAAIVVQGWVPFESLSGFGEP